MSRNLIILTVAVLAIGLVAGYLVASRGGPEGDPKILYWVAPMDPNYRRDQPGKSPMGMDLVPVYEGEEATAGSSISIDPSVTTNIGVRTARAEHAALNVPVRTVGRITYDQERLAHIHLRSDGWIEKLTVKAVGEPVARGDLLFTVYAPELVNAQAEFLQALSSGRTALVEASRARLRALDISDSQIRDIEATRSVDQYVKVYAPMDGVITKLGAADGMFVMPATEIMEIAELSPVWLIADVFESDMARLRLGAAVTAVSAYDPGRMLEGVVDYIYPDLNPMTRTVPVRALFDNTDGELKPGMFMSVEIAGAARPMTTVIPAEALIRTGRGERVILQEDDSHFRPARVVSGLEADGRVEILEGLAVGETVVVSGQFLIDSESSLSGAELRLSGPGERMDMPPDGTMPEMNHDAMESGKEQPDDHPHH